MSVFDFTPLVVGNEIFALLRLLVPKNTFDRRMLGNKSQLLYKFNRIKQKLISSVRSHSDTISARKDHQSIPYIRIYV